MTKTLKGIKSLYFKGIYSIEQAAALAGLTVLNLIEELFNCFLEEKDWVKKEKYNEWDFI